MSQMEKELLGYLQPHVSAGLAARSWLWQKREGEPAPELESVFRRQSRQAGSLCERLLELPPGSQAGKIRRTQCTYASEPLARVLLQRSRKAVFDDSKEALRLAELAWEVAYALARSPALCGGRPGLFDLNARVLAEIANVHRVACDWRKAEGAFDRAFRLLGEGSLDPLLEAEVLSLFGSFLRERRRLKQAVAVLRRAAELCGEFAAAQQQARNLLLLATVWYELDDLDRATATNLRAWRLIDQEEEPRLAVSAWHNQAFFAAMAGRFEEAAAHLEEGPPALARFQPGSTDLAIWARLRGLVAQGLGRLSLAEQELVDALRRFQALNDVYQEALVALDLAALYLQEHRDEEVTILAEAAFKGLKSQSLEEKAQQAVALFLEATRRQAVTLEIVRHAAAALQRHPILRRGSAATAPAELRSVRHSESRIEPALRPVVHEAVREAELPFNQIDPWRFGRALRWLRFDRQMECAEMVKKAGVTRGMLTSYETGAKRPSAATLEKIFEVLGADGDDLREALLMVPGTEFLPDETLPVPKAQEGKGLDVRVLAAVLEEPELADAADAALRRVLGEYRRRKWGYP